MNQTLHDLITKISVLCVVFIAGMLFNQLVTRPVAAPMASPRAAQQLTPTTIVAERADRKEKPPVKPIIPKRTKILDTATATYAPDQADCPATAVTCTVVEEEDKNRRIVFSTSAGTITDPIHYQVEKGNAKPAQLNWSVSAISIYDATRREWSYGAEVGRSFGAVTTTVGVTTDQMKVGVGFRF